MSAIAKGVTIGVLVSASLAAPIVATVTYLQTRPPAALPTLPDAPEAPEYELSAIIAEPDLAELETPRATAPPPPSTPTRAVTAVLPQPAAPRAFQLELPRVERAAVLGAREASSPSVRSPGMPEPIARDGEQTALEYEETFR